MLDFPIDFLNSLDDAPGFHKNKFIESHKENPPVSVRFNPFKKANTGLNIGEQVPWCENAYYLDNRPVFTADPLFHAGCYYVQEASSMFLDFALKQVCDFEKDLSVLDFCAAPGGKTTLLLSLLSSQSLLVANELVPKRGAVLAQNIAKWGTSNTLVTCSSSETFSNIRDFFDLVLVDAPCSGSGLFRKQPEAMDEWSLAHAKSCSLRQKKMLEELFPVLKEGAVLVYSTCSYSCCENEEVVNFLIKTGMFELLKINIPTDWGVIDSGMGYRFYPYHLRGEGFFCAFLKYMGNNRDNFKKESGKTAKWKKATEKEKALFDPFLKKNWKDEFDMIFKNDFKLLNNNVLRLIEAYSEILYIKEIGTKLGGFKQNDFIPAHEFALSIHKNTEISEVKLSREQALLFLKREMLKLSSDNTGLSLITYGGCGIGWAKFIQNRINNYLPAEYTIKNRNIA